MKLCVIYRTAPHYREAIFKSIDEKYDCDWYFGESYDGIKKMDFNKLKRVTKSKILGSTLFYWQKGVVPLLFQKRYQTFFMLGEVRSLSCWVFWVLAFLFFPKKKVYLWTHGWYGKEGCVEATLKLWLYRHCTGVFTYGEYARSCMIEQGIDGNKIFTLKNSLKYDEQLALREQLSRSDIFLTHFGNDNPVLLFIGRLTAVKSLDTLVNSLSILKARKENFNLVFVGEGEEKVSLQNLVRKLGLEENVWFYGACYDERENAELIYNAEICVSPGNVGLTAMHVMMFGTPVVTHNDFKWQMPEFEAVKSGVTGEFFEKGNVEDLAEKISEWYKMKSDKREEVRKACYQEMDAYWNPHYQMNVISENISMG